MGRFNYTVIGTAATVSVLKVENMPESGKSTPVYSGSICEYENGGMGLNICAALATLDLAVYPVLTYADIRQKSFIYDFCRSFKLPKNGIMDPPECSYGTTIMIQDSCKNHMTLITEYEHRRPGSTFFSVQKIEDEFLNDSDCIILTAPMPCNSNAIMEAINRSSKPLALSMRKDSNAFPHDMLWKALTYCTLLFGNEVEMKYIETEFNLNSFLRLFSISQSLKYIIVTRGGRGNSVYSRNENGGIDEIRTIAVEPEGDCIYSVGAGDGFVSGFMYGLAKGHSIKDCSLLGSTLSSFVLEDEGSITNLPTEARLLERFSKWREK